MKRMNEIEQAVILAAGRSRRMEELSDSKPKCLLEYDNETIIKRLVRQLKENGVKKIVISIGYKRELLKEAFKNDENVILVENEFYAEDINLYSMKLALEHIDGPCVMFEGDLILEDDLVKYVVGSDFENKTVWFTRGKFKSPQYGGILKADKNGIVKDIKIIPFYNDKYENYSKLSGMVRMNSSDIFLYKRLVNKYAESTIKQYYFEPLADNLDLLVCEEADISNFEIFTFNKPEEYYQIVNKKIGFKQACPDYQLVDIEKLRDIEDHDKDRMEKLIAKIEEEQVWTMPLIVEKKYNMVLDGHHRLNAARKMQLKRIPVVYVDYNDVLVWSLRKEYKIKQKDVKKMVIDNKKIYPYKTVKHKYNFKVKEIKINLEELK